MTAPLTHPLLRDPKADPKIAAAIASLAYWTQPARPAAPRAPEPEMTPLDQMYAYYG